MEQRARETKIKPRIFNFSAKPQQKISPFHSYPQLRYLIGCVYFGAYGVHSCPLLQTSRFLLLCSVGLPLKTQNERRGGKKAGDIWWITDGSEWDFSPWHRHTKNAKSRDHYRQRGAITLCLFLPLNLFPSLLRMISASHFSPLLYWWIDLLLSKSATCADEMTR